MASLMRWWKQRWRTIVLRSGVHAGFGAQKHPTSSSPLPADMTCIPLAKGDFCLGLLFLRAALPKRDVSSLFKMTIFPLSHQQAETLQYTTPTVDPYRDPPSSSLHQPPHLQPACASYQQKLNTPTHTHTHTPPDQAPKKCTIRY